MLSGYFSIMRKKKKKEKEKEHGESVPRYNMFY